MVRFLQNSIKNPLIGVTTPMNFLIATGSNSAQQSILFCSFISTQSLMGTPAEVYKYGSTFIYLAFASIFGTVVSLLVFHPVYRKLKITSVFEVRFLMNSNALILVKVSALKFFYNLITFGF